MRKVIRLVSFYSAFVSPLTLLRPRSGTIRILLWIPKSMAEAMTPFLALLGAIGTLLGLVFKDAIATLLGMFGFLTSLRHVARVTARHKEFDRVFREGWDAYSPAA